MILDLIISGLVGFAVFVFTYVLIGGVWQALSEEKREPRKVAEQS